MNIGKNIRKFRKSKGLTIKSLSKQSTVSNGYISDLENEKETRPSLDILGKLAKVLDVPVVKLLEEDSQSNTNTIEEYSPNDTNIDINYNLSHTNYKFIQNDNYANAIAGLNTYINYVTKKNKFELNDIDSEEIIELIESIVLTKIKFYKMKKARQE